MSQVRAALVKLQALFGLIGLVALTPLLVSAAILSRLIAKLCCCSPPKSIEGEVAVVTGAGHGLGRAISLELAKKGCHIAVVDINLSGAENTVKQIQETYNVRAKAYKTKFVFLPPMKALRRGFIVTISSLAGIFPLPYSAAYTASKAGTLAHMRALQMELQLEKQKDIHVTTVLPTFLRTNDEITELTKTIGINNLYPLITGEEVAQRVVSGMMRGEHEITLPGLASVLYRLLYLLPSDWQLRMILLLSDNQFKRFCEVRLRS
ncbi:hypothetical protein M5D96_002007 [Drosophila gunungcola]|uniref:Estradiol 17-beta-dehydrogenase 11 n=1 Tax=Drosophila gunungcola TaxID=103775 RepID=A0A9P9YZZ1_9MUSC|nr:hypothetical protein M5D96_002007 [Drosophila gunungcola]